MACIDGDFQTGLMMMAQEKNLIQGVTQTLNFGLPGVGEK